MLRNTIVVLLHFRYKLTDLINNNDNNNNNNNSTEAPLEQNPSGL
jgi:hypothetical protein